MLFIQKLIRNKVIRSAYLAWFVISLFYLYQYIIRVAPGVMVDEIRLAFNITAEQFATLGAFYLIGYSLLQIPIGVVVDRIGVKRMSQYSIGICIFGNLLFGSTEDFLVAQISRFIIGVGSASAFMCALKFVADHFAPGSRAFLMGATLALGTVGAMLSAKSVKYIGAKVGWHDVVIITAMVGLFVLFFISLCVKHHQQDTYEVLNRKSFKAILKSIWDIITDKQIMIYAVLAIGLYTPLSALADLWGTAFIKEKFGLKASSSAEISQLMYIGLTIGSLFLPWVAEKYNKLNATIVGCGFCILLIFSIILYAPGITASKLRFLLLMLGFFCGAEVMCFTGALFKSHKFDSGEIIGVVNTLNMLGGAILQQLIGWLLDKQWDGLYDVNGIRQYTTDQFVVALTSLTTVIFLCCLISLFLVGKSTRFRKI
jgi:sugar phosphate permease